MRVGQPSQAPEGPSQHRPQLRLVRKPQRVFEGDGVEGPLGRAVEGEDASGRILARLDRHLAHREDIGVELGLVPLGAWTSTVDEWDDFEWTYQRIVERRAHGSPDDADAGRRLEQRREWMEGYLRWGRETLGYGTYLFQRSPV